LPRLEAHDWPGNVRELKAVLERAVLLARGGEIGPAQGSLAQVSPEAAVQPPAPLSPQETHERTRIVEALEACAGNQTRAARRLGISRATLVNKLALYHIPRPRK
jgi:two-component system, NtrC family, response regulator AtoC